jgi:hypothetical protein
MIERLNNKFQMHAYNLQKFWYNSTEQGEESRHILLSDHAIFK